jgi:hypothetical protein
MILFVYVRAEARTLHLLKPVPFIDWVLSPASLAALILRVYGRTEGRPLRRPDSIQKFPKGAGADPVLTGTRRCALPVELKWGRGCDRSR